MATDLAEGPSSSFLVIAQRAERRWLVVLGTIVFSLLFTMLFTGLHWAAMPPSRVATVNPATLHVAGEFMEGNLGSGVEAAGITVRVIAQQYSFVPACLVVPAGVPVTFRVTSADAIHGFSIGGTNVNTMVVPGFISTFTTTFKTVGEHLMPCHEFCGSGHANMWAHVRVIPEADFLTQTPDGRRANCVQE